MRKANRPSIESLVGANIARSCADGRTLAVAVSGGVDSIALLHALHAVGRWDLVACHFNHGIRGAESDLDEHLVRESAERLGIAFCRGGADVPDYCAQKGISIEEGARLLRYAYLSQAATKLGADAIVLAHHADDQVETSFAHYLRGSGARGLGGMVRWEPRRRLLRPLLSVPKADLVDYARAHNLQWREDASNACTDHDRNWLRNIVIPMLEERRPGFRRVAMRQAEHFSALHDFLMDSARKWLQQQSERAPKADVLFSVNEFVALPEVLQGEILAQVWAATYGSRQGFASKRQAEVLRWATVGRNGGSVFFGDGHRLVNRNGWVSIDERSCELTPAGPGF